MARNNDDVLMEDELAAAFLDEGAASPAPAENSAELEAPADDDGSDNILTISGVLSGGEDEHTTRWHIQECYWGEFSRTIALPVQVREDENSVKAELKDGVLTITFEKEKVEAPKKIQIQ